MGYTENDFINADMELYIIITGFDDLFSSPVVTNVREYVDTQAMARASEMPTNPI